MQNQNQDFYEIYDYYSQPLLEKTSVQVSIVLVATAIIIGLAILLIIWYRSKKTLTFWEISLLELHRLNPEKCSNKNDFKNLYFKLTGIFKKYLDKRFDWQTETKTDDELIRFLASQNFNSEMLSQIQKILDGALWIKFANQDALKIQAEADLKVIINIITQTKPIEQK